MDDPKEEDALQVTQIVGPDWIVCQNRTQRREKADLEDTLKRLYAERDSLMHCPAPGEHVVVRNNGALRRAICWPNSDATIDFMFPRVMLLDDGSFIETCIDNCFAATDLFDHVPPLFTLCHLAYIKMDPNTWSPKLNSFLKDWMFVSTDIRPIFVGQPVEKHFNSHPIIFNSHPIEISFSEVLSASVYSCKDGVKPWTFYLCPELAKVGYAEIVDVQLGQEPQEQPHPGQEQFQQRTMVDGLGSLEQVKRWREPDHPGLLPFDAIVSYVEGPGIIFCYQEKLKAHIQAISDYLNCLYESVDLLLHYDPDKRWRRLDECVVYHDPDWVRARILEKKPHGPQNQYEVLHVDSGVHSIVPQELLRTAHVYQHLPICVMKLTLVDLDESLARKAVPKIAELLKRENCEVRVQIFPHGSQSWSSFQPVPAKIWLPNASEDLVQCLTKMT